jgi:hypothetical protein
MKSSAKSRLSNSNSRTNSGSVASGVAPAFNLATILSLLVAILGGRKEAEVAGRLGMYDVAGVVAIRAVEAARPVTVAGRIRAAVCDDFFAEPAVGVGVIRGACPREGT